MKHYQAKPICFLLCCCVGLSPKVQIFAQSAPKLPEKPLAQVWPSMVSPDSLTFKEKYDYFLKSTFSPGALLRASAGAGINQWRNFPPEWEQGMEGYSRRLGSLFGQHMIRMTVQFSVGAIRHEDPRYFRSEQTGSWARIQDAIKGTFIVRTDNGTRTFAVGRVAGALSGGLISMTWYPEAERSWGLGFERAGTALGVDVGFNIFREFWPDLKRHFHKH